MKKNYKVIKYSVEKAGGKIELLETRRECWRISYKGRVFYIKGSFKIFRSFLDTSFLAAFKDLTREIFKAGKFSFPKTLVASELQGKKELNELLDKVKPPFILKDAAGSLSVGVFANIESKKRAREILERELKNYKKMLIQEMVSGKEYRVLVLDKKILGALRMIPPYIVGDGKKTVKALIEEKQRKNKKKTPQDEDLFRLLKSQGEGLDSIPKKQKKVFIRSSSCLAEGGEMIDETDKISDGLAKECIRLASACGLALAGIDLFCEDISLPIEKQEIKFIEVNSRPDLYIHYFSTKGKTRDVVKEILDYIIKII